MTNLFLSITLYTNQPILRIDVSNSLSSHLYSIQTSCALLIDPPGTTNWQKGWIFKGDTTQFYDYADSNKFYKVEDLGERF